MSSGPKAASPAENTVNLFQIAAADLGEVTGMAALIWPVAYGAILSPGQVEYMLRWMYAEETLRKDLADGVSMWWIRTGGKRIGFLAAGPTSGTGLCPLHKFYLLPGEQGRGHGSAALALLLSQLSANGATTLELRVNRQNQSAIAFYKKNRFTLHAEDCREIGGGYVMDDFVMRRPLGGTI